jgi:SAM-dependent methyltransferase
VAHRRFDLFEKVTGGPGTILDVGSGTGEVLMVGRERGWSVQGVEPERTGARMAVERGLPVEVAMLEESGVPERSWDVVSAFHVLEHVPDPRRFLRMLGRWARPGGHVVVEVPNFASVQRRRWREGWPGLRPLEHIVHFTPATLERTLRESHLEPLLVRTPTYIGPPQNLHFAVGDLARGPRFRRAIAPLAPKQEWNGARERVPSQAGWAVLRAIDALYDRKGVGTVVFTVSRAPWG